MTIKPEVLAEFDEWMDFILAEYPSGQKNWQIIRDELLAMDTDIMRLRKIEEERWSVVATRNAAVMRAEIAEADVRRYQFLRRALKTEQEKQA